MSLKKEIEEIGEFDAGWTTFDFKFVSDLGKDDEPLLGEVDFEKFTITFCTKQSERTLRKTLLHEIMHLVTSLTGVKHRDEDVSELLTAFSNEYITEQVTRGLLLLKRLNPEVFALALEI